MSEVRITNEMVEAARAKGRELAGNQPGALVEAMAEIAEHGARAALSGMGEPVKVKPLEWLERDYYYAYVPTFPTGYCVSFEDAKHWLTLDGIRKVGEDTFRGPYPSRDEAVAAAQTDYERRILSALATPPASEREEIERLKALLSRTQRHLKLFEGTSGYRDGEIQLLRDVSAALQTEGK